MRFTIFIMLLIFGGDNSVFVRKCCEMKKRLGLGYSGEERVICLDSPLDNGISYETGGKNDADLDVIIQGSKDAIEELRVQSTWEEVQFLDSSLTVKNDSDMKVLPGPKFPCDDFDIVRVDGDVFLLEDGSLLRTRLQDDNVQPENATFPSNSFCLDNIGVDEYPGGIFVALLCPCPHTTCLRTCCLKGQYYDTAKKRCEDSAYTPEAWNFTYKDYADNVVPSSRNFILKHAPPKCERGAYFLNKSPGKGNEFWILPEGEARLKHKKDVPNDRYCVTFTKSFTNDTFEENLLICKLKGKAADKFTFKEYLYGIYYIIGSLFLAFTLAIYGLVPELRKSLHSHNLMGHTASLFIAYATLAFTAFFTNWSIENAKFLCILAAYLIQFSFISAFLWLNVMCMDIAWTFSGYRSLHGYSTPENRRRIFLAYSAYSWGISLLILLATFIADNTDIADESYKPKYGRDSCWSNEFKAVFVFFYLPVGLILVANLFLFAYTSLKIVLLERDSSGMMRGDCVRHVGKQRSKDRHRLVLYVKLFSLMGLTWFFELLGFLVKLPDYYWYIPDAVNALRGVFVFVIFCWKPKILYYVCNRLPTPLRRKYASYYRDKHFSTTESIHSHSHVTKHGGGGGGGSGVGGGGGGSDKGNSLRMSHLHGSNSTIHEIHHENTL